MESRKMNEIVNTEAIKRTPLREHFLQDKKLFLESFAFGEFYVLTKVIQHKTITSQLVWRMDRTVRRKDKIFLKTNAERYMFKHNDDGLKLGDIIFFSKGDAMYDGKDKKYSWEYINTSFTTKEQEELTEEQKVKLLKKRFKKIKE